MPAHAAASILRSPFRGHAGMSPRAGALRSRPGRWAEFVRAAGRFASLAAAWTWLGTAPRGDGHPVLVVPGPQASETLTAPLRAYLRGRGFDVHGWKPRRCIGEQDLLAADLLACIERLSRAAGGRRVTLVGAGLGNSLAREASRARCDLVRAVITLGSVPSAGDTMAQAAGVPCTAIFPLVDGAAHSHACGQRLADDAEHIAIECSHQGLVHHPLAFYVVADRLAQPEGAWQRFEPPAGTSLFDHDVESEEGEEGPRLVEAALAVH